MCPTSAPANRSSQEEGLAREVGAEGISQVTPIFYLGPDANLCSVRHLCPVQEARRPAVQWWRGRYRSMLCSSTSGAACGRGRGKRTSVSDPRVRGCGDVDLSEESMEKLADRDNTEPTRELETPVAITA